MPCRRNLFMNALQDFLPTLLGPDGKATELTLLQIVLRGFIIFIAGLAIVRIGDRRSLAEKTAFDAIFIVLVGSMLSRAINGTGPFITPIGDRRSLAEKTAYDAIFIVLVGSMLSRAINGTAPF